MNAVLLDIGGFLGMGERSVALSMDQLQLVSGMNDGGEYYVVFNGTAESLENAPEYDASAIGAWAEDTQADNAAADGAATGAMATDTAATDMEKSADPAMTNSDTAATDPAMTETDSAAADSDMKADDPAMADTDTAATDDMAADKTMDTADADGAMADGPGDLADRARHGRRRQRLLCRASRCNR